MENLADQLRKKKIEEDAASAELQVVQVVKQALHDDQSLAPVADNIQVTVKDGVITLDGEVDTDQQITLATNTATALDPTDKLKNEIEKKDHK